MLCVVFSIFAFLNHLVHAMPYAAL